MQLRCRKFTLKERYAWRGDSTVERRVKEGLLPPPTIEQRIPYWWTAELDAIDELRLKGGSDDDVRRLVRELVAARQNGSRLPYQPIAA